MRNEEMSEVKQSRGAEMSEEEIRSAMKRMRNEEISEVEQSRRLRGVMRRSEVR
jgi:hypothetical protein